MVGLENKVFRQMSVSLLVFYQSFEVCDYEFTAQLEDELDILGASKVDKSIGEF